MQEYDYICPNCKNILVSEDDISSMEIECPSCHELITASKSKATKVAGKRCASCQAILPNGAIFCMNCKTEVPKPIFKTILTNPWVWAITAAILVIGVGITLLVISVGRANNKREAIAIEREKSRVLEKEQALERAQKKAQVLKRYEESKIVYEKVKEKELIQSKAQEEVTAKRLKEKQEKESSYINPEAKVSPEERAAFIKRTLGSYIAVEINDQKYEKCKITRIEPDGITVLYAKGVVKIPFPDLEEQYSREYGYTKSEAEEYAQQIQAKLEKKKEEALLAQQRKHENETKNKVENNYRPKYVSVACPYCKGRGYKEGLKNLRGKRSKSSCLKCRGTGKVKRISK